MAETEARNPQLAMMALAAAASGVAVSIGAFAFGLFEIWHAAIGLAGSAGVGALVISPWARDFRDLALRARSVGEEDPAPQPMARRTSAGAEVARALIESRRRVNAMQRALEERSITGERVLDAAPEPLIVIDIRHTISHANRAAERAFGGDLFGRALVDVIRSPELLEATERVASGDQDTETVDFEASDRGPRSYRAIVGRLERIGEAGETAVIALQDLTTIRRLEAMRADFVANASHELRTPLATLVGFIETLEGPAQNDPEARVRFLGIMREQAGRMTRLVEDLLSLSRIEMEEFAPPGRTDDLNGLIASVIEQLEPISRAHGVEISFQPGLNTSPVAGDPDLLQQVFRNLVENALNYGKDGQSVQIQLSSHGASTAVAIQDFGPGIPAEHIPRLTERFYRVDVSRSRDLGGTGLGLAIVKHILNRCRGELKIMSEVGHGATFTVILPQPASD